MAWICKAEGDEGELLKLFRVSLGSVDVVTKEVRVVSREEESSEEVG